METLCWDEDNLAHLRERNAELRAAGKREITREEVDALYDSADYTTQDMEYLTRDGWEIQVRLIGRTPEGRFLTIACDVLDDGGFRPATVWTSSAAERRRYRQDMEGEG